MVNVPRLRRLACEHCGARAWVDGQCLRCGKPMTAIEVESRKIAHPEPAAIFSPRAIRVVAGVLTGAMLAVLVPAVLGLTTPPGMLVFALILFGFVILQKLRPRRKRS